MGASLLTTGSRVHCPHGGQAVLTTANQRVRTRSGHVLLERDAHLVSGCPFTVGTTPSPCVRIEWESPATRAAVGAIGVLLDTSIGVCVNAGKAPQGVAQVVQAEPKVAAR